MPKDTYKGKDEVTEKEAIEVYQPSEEDQKELRLVYTALEDMIKERDRTYRQFNDRTLIQFVDDSEKRVQGYVPSREAQGKEEWESNVFNQTTRNKLKAIVASVATSPPDLKYKAISREDGGMDLRRAGVIENLVKHSRYKSNPEVELFWEAWGCATQGTIIKYDGYLKTKYNRKFIKSYDLVTGDVEFEEREVVVDDECVDYQVPISEFFIADFMVPDVQDQPDVAWVRYMNREKVDEEFLKYKNHKYIKNGAQVGEYQNDTETFFYTRWKDRVEGEDEYEVIKYYNKTLDKYCIVINGVLVLSVPLLWGGAKKMYPFAKSIFEPFSIKEFFYGNSIANANMDSQDTINALYNMSLDKTYRSLRPARLAGMQNKDLLEMENEAISMDTTIYVEDVNQVKYETVPGLSNSEMAMIKWVSQGMDLGTVDQTQQGVAGRGVTAREIVIANENAKKLKGIFFMFLTDLWIQKTRLRIPNILTNYTIPKVKEIVGPTGTKTYEESFRKILVNGSTFPDGSKGTLEIQFVQEKEKLPTREDLDIEEEKFRIQGEKYEKVAFTTTYLDNYDYDVEVISESLFQKDAAEAQAVFEQKLKIMAAFFPEMFGPNKGVLFDEFIDTYGEDPSKYNTAPPAPAPVPGEEEVPPSPNPLKVGEEELGKLTG